MHYSELESELRLAFVIRQRKKGNTATNGCEQPTEQPSQIQRCYQWLR